MERDDGQAAYSVSVCLSRNLIPGSYTMRPDRQTVIWPVHALSLFPYQGRHTWLVPFNMILNWEVSFRGINSLYSTQAKEARAKAEIAAKPKRPWLGPRPGLKPGSAAVIKPPLLR